MRAHGPNLGFPAELHSVRGKALEDYVHSRILDFALEQSFARRLYTSPSRVYAAAKEALAELSRPVESSASGRDLRLVFRHTCQSLGCLNPDCLMCTNSPHRRCATAFAPKYLSGDSLKAKCGAPIFVEVLDSRGQPVSQDAVKGLHLEICIVEGKAYDDADPSSISDAFLEANKLLLDSKGKEVLGPGRNCESTDDKRVVARFSQGKAELSVNILGSSIAMLTGQKPQFRLWVRARNSATGHRATDVAWVVSDAFVVATQRVKGAQKAEIPHVEEHVSKIENVGVQTQHKLQDIRAAASTAGITGINVMHNSVTTVGQFRDLVESTAKDMPLQETLRKVLNFTSKGWDAAKAHAMKAVETDNRMRIWLSDDTHTRGLLFRCHLGRIDIDSPVGMLSGKGDQPGSGDQLEVHAVLAQHPQFDRQAVVWMQKKAVKCWWKLGHPGWSIWPADSEQFIRNVVEAGDGLTAVQIQANVPITSHASATQSGLTNAEDGTASEPGASVRGQSLSLAVDSIHPHTGSASAGGASGGASLTLGQASINKDGSRNGAGSRNRFANSGSPDPVMGPRTSESGPSLTSAMPTSLPPQSALSRLAPGQQGGISWPFAMPLVSSQALANRTRHLPASPFDLPAAPTVSASEHISNTSSTPSGFSFRPPQNSKTGTGLSPQQQNSLPPFSILPTLTTQDMDQLMELQRRLNNANESASQPVSNISALTGLPEGLGQGDAALPHLFSRLSGLIADPNFTSVVEARAQPSNAQLNSQYISQFLPALRQGEGETQMPLKISGKVSGILDDLSDAMSLLNELLPSSASDLQLQTHAARGSEHDLQWPSALSNNGLSFYNLPSGLQYLEAPQMPLHSSAEGSSGLPKFQSSSMGGFDAFQPAAKRKRTLVDSQHH